MALPWNGAKITNKYISYVFCSGGWRTEDRSWGLWKETGVQVQSYCYIKKTGLLLHAVNYLLILYIHYIYKVEYRFKLHKSIIITYKSSYKSNLFYFLVFLKWKYFIRIAYKIHFLMFISQIFSREEGMDACEKKNRKYEESLEKVGCII